MQPEAPRPARAADAVGGSVLSVPRKFEVARELQPRSTDG